MSEDMQLDEVNPTESPTENTSQDRAPDEWQTLAGRSQDRVKKIIAMKNEALDRMREIEQENQRLRSQTMASVPAPMPAYQSNDISYEERLAAERLKSTHRFVTQDQLEAEREKIRREFQSVEDRKILDQAHEKLEEKYAKEGLPAYDRQEIEERMAQTRIYDPEYQYEKLNAEEILTAKLKKLSTQSSQPYSERTRSRITANQEWTPESVAERLRKKDGTQFYLKNKDKIDRMHSDWMRGE